MIQYYKKDKERGSGGEWILIERLDKILAGTGRWSRREAGELVRAGRVEAAGAVARRPEEKYEREGLDLRVDGEQVCGERYVYLMLHKPAGLLSATEDPRQPTVLDLLRSISGGWDCFRWGGWTRIRRVCSSSPTTARWDTAFSRPRVMWTKCTLSAPQGVWMRRTPRPSARA